MYTSNRSANLCSILKQPERNRFFHGKMMGVADFERETGYHNAKRYLINRLVLGYGVVCGLDVKPGKDFDKIYVEPGFAIDQCGREILVTQDVGPLTIPPDVLDKAISELVPDYYMSKYGKPYHQEEVGCIRVLLCYQECETDPAPSLAGDCSDYDPCMPTTIREQYRIRFKAGCDEPEEHECQLHSIISNGRINYPELVEWVTDRDCFELPEDPCIPLAHIMIEQTQGHHCNPDYIDTTIRPICYTNDLLWELILGLISDRQRDRIRK
jgi:hypothetical protein